MNTAEADVGRHEGHTAGAVSVAEMVERAARAGQALCLNWPAEEAEEDGPTAVHHGEWPTAVLPQVKSDQADVLLRRGDVNIPSPDEPVHVQRDPEVLRRVRDGLRGLK
jgi:hypothetical protein